MIPCQHGPATTTFTTITTSRYQRPITLLKGYRSQGQKSESEEERGKYFPGAGIETEAGEEEEEADEI